MRLRVAATRRRRRRSVASGSSVMQRRRSSRAAATENAVPSVPPTGANCCSESGNRKGHVGRSMNRPYTIATLGSHSALQILKGAHDEGFHTLAIANRDTERLYRSFGFVDEVIGIDKYSRFIGLIDGAGAAQVHHRSARLVRCVSFARRAQADDDSVLRQQGRARLGSQPRTAAPLALARGLETAAPVQDAAPRSTGPVSSKLYGAAGGKGYMFIRDARRFRGSCRRICKKPTSSRNTSSAYRSIFTIFIRR